MRIHHLAAAPWDDDLVVTGAFERAVEVWSSRRGDRVAAFDTVLDGGGRRLALAHVPDPVVVAGAWVRHGVRGYGLDGSDLWRNRSRTNVQTLTALTGGRVAVGYEGRPTVVLDGATGKEVLSLRGVTGVVALDTRTTLLSGTGWLRLADADLTPSWRRTRATGFTVACAAGPETVAVVEAAAGGSGIRVFDRDGTERTSITWPGQWIGPVCHDAASGTWVAVRQDDDTGRSVVVRVTDDGEVLEQRPWHAVHASAVVRGGRVLAYGNDDGIHLLDVADLSVSGLAAT
jgi:hypothetical protein